ncbi:hypothetical protein BOTBODRAFT_36617 [Botryobasidium botryosum FD-172 SS1]|uniref:Cytochrome P450 n=1 Tax=Botryobasidium botryosum (strain FD-172 SS1) TaxID=930990 RepID=A0A067M367_BOTB1|nr:hypothetical protein BOTBODRAFT_36617 [Botryobasidium botryosum FD-172 SS1]
MSPFPDSWLVTLGGLSIFSFVSVLYFRYQSAAASINGFPGIRTVFNAISAPGVLTRGIPGLSLPQMYKWEQKYKLYQRTGWDIYSGISVWPKVSVSFSVADAGVAKEIVQNKATFPKTPFALFNFYGPNVVTVSDNEEAKRYKKVAAPAFSERNNKLVWRETSRIIGEIFAHWGEKETVSVNNIVDITLPLALHVISAAGFGRPISWEDEAGSGQGIIPAGHLMSYQEAIRTVSNGVFTRLVVPSWAMGLRARWRKIAVAFDELGKYMSEMIESRRREGDTIKTDEDGELYKSDLFSNLLAASDAEVSGKGALSERELMGNISVFLLAGHETTAHALAFAMGLLACYPEEQQKLHDHIKSALPDGRLPKYEDISLLTRSLAVFYEATRLFPGVPVIAKSAACDKTLTIAAAIPPGAEVADGKHDQRKAVFIPKGTLILLDVVGLHYNPRNWKDPDHFNPERFMNADWNRDAFMAFNAGSRACLGRRFSEIEAVTALTMITMRYKIELNGDLFQIIPGEAPRATRERLLKVTQGMTLALSEKMFFPYSSLCIFGPIRPVISTPEY